QYRSQALVAQKLLVAKMKVRWKINRLKEEEVDRLVRGKLILAITKKLPGYQHHSGAIEKNLKQHHKMQCWTATINIDSKLKAYNRVRMGKNSK
ncbi:12802_t:CDS:2, partial [Racocetra fulgida]